VVVYPLICGAIVEKDSNPTLHGNNGYVFHFQQHFWVDVEVFDEFWWIRFKRPYWGAG
jgi:hypothetical protein